MTTVLLKMNYIPQGCLIPIDIDDYHLYLCPDTGEFLEEDGDNGILAWDNDDKIIEPEIARCSFVAIQIEEQIEDGEAESDDYTQTLFDFEIESFGYRDAFEELGISFLHLWKQYPGHGMLAEVKYETEDEYLDGHILNSYLVISDIVEKESEQ